MTSRSRVGATHDDKWVGERKTIAAVVTDKTTRGFSPDLLLLLYPPRVTHLGKF